ncbi:pollen-specific leucine-rich repeat extensin-like protein 3 [Quercus suber]|uniref:pollen-specific leucine-rich repeat extensin-like protein 3 n=1 Tax=Quercus suber TaxID=58331 RepID=UPI000CE1E802|nr:pollen-specific leucine-rich repeat extensin-like protein 3 [Quercus suber]
MEKLTYASDEKELSVEHRRGQPLKFARLVQQPPVVEPPPQLEEQLPPLVEPPPLLVEQLPPVEEQAPPVEEQPSPIVEQPPPIVEQPPPPGLARRRVPEPLPPSPIGPPGPGKFP